MKLASPRVLAPLAIAGAIALAYRARRGRPLKAMIDNLHTFSMPSAGVYSAISEVALSRFYRWVAADSASLAQGGSVLDVGTGPGHLVRALAAIVPDASIQGVDILPAMIDRANARAASEGLASRVLFSVADVGALPFGDGQLDLVVSTLSLHHWPDPARGLAEIHRVLKSGGQARIYDVADWIKRVETRVPGLRELALSSPFETAHVETVARIGPLAILQRAALIRA